MSSTFCQAFCHANSATETQKPTIALCSACLDLIFNASICSSSKIDRHTLLNTINSLSFAPVKFTTFQRHVKRSPYPKNALLTDVDRISNGNGKQTQICHACFGALQNIDETTFALAKAVVRSPYLDAKEIGFSTVVPAKLCLLWNCIFGLFVECSFLAGAKISDALTQSVFTIIKNPPSSNLENPGTDSSPCEKQEETDKEETYFSWHGLACEGITGGGLRSQVVADVRNIGLECLVPPNECAFVDAESTDASTNQQPQQQQQPHRWRYATQGLGSGIVCQIEFQNQTISDSVLGNVAPVLCQHDSPEATWKRLIKEVAPFVATHFSKTTSISSPQIISTMKTTAIISVSHEPLFLYGRYRKFSRTMSQSPWFTKLGVRVGNALSLQEEISNRLLQAFFPGCDLNQVNAEAARTDVRLVGMGVARKTHGPNLAAAASSSSFSSAPVAQDHGRLIKQEVHNLRKNQAPLRRDREAEARLKNSGNNNQKASNNGVIENGENTAAVVVADEDDEASPGFHAHQYHENIFCFSLYRFHAGGREDVDVRMLGNGRPFVLEILHPHRQNFSESELAQLAQKVSDASETVEIDSLRIVNRNIMLELQRDAESKKKAYRCVCYSQRPLSKNDACLSAIKTKLPVTLQQKTPTRVLHRRTSLVRQRKLYSIDIELLNPHWVIVDLVTQAGTYVKEFCHGDLGRTMPNLATLLESPFTDIIQLDVLYLISATQQQQQGNGAVDGAEGGGDDDDESEASDGDD